MDLQNANGQTVVAGHREAVRAVAINVVTKHIVYLVTVVLLSMFSGTRGQWQSKNIKQKIIGRNTSEVLSCIQL